MKEKVSFRDSLGNKVVGILSNPSDTLDRPVMLLCHGLASNKESQTYVGLEHALNILGIATFKIDLYAHGESEGKFEDLTISKAVGSVLAAIKLLKSKGYQRIGLVGMSFGGMCSIMAASRSKELFLLVLQSPVSDFVEFFSAKIGAKGIIKWKEDGSIPYQAYDGRVLKLSYSFFEDSERNIGYGAAKKILIPTLIVHGDKDMVVPIEQSVKTSKIIKNCEFETIKGGDHYFRDSKLFAERLRIVVGFIQSHL